LQVATKLVDSDFKHGRVEDITQVSDKQQQKIKKYCKDYFEKAVAKQRAHEKKKADKKPDDSKSKDTTPQAQAGSPDDEPNNINNNNESDRDFDMDHDGGDSEQQEPAMTKRKRDTDAELDKGNASPMKRPKSSTPLLDQQSLPPSEVEDEDEEDDEERLNDELPHGGLAASSHQSIGVVQ
jgi:histone-lysine N-methyltransferase SETD2